MTNPHIQTSEPTAVDDVRRMREKIDCEYGSDLQGRVDETTQFAAVFRAHFNVRLVPAPKADSKRSGAHA